MAVRGRDVICPYLYDVYLHPACRTLRPLSRLVFSSLANARRRIVPRARQVDHPSGADSKSTAEWEACSILDGRPDYAGDALMGCTDDGAGKGCTPLCIAKVLAAGNLWQGQRDLLPFTCMNNIFMTYGCSEVRHEVNFHRLPYISMSSPCPSPSRRAQR